MTSTTDRPAGAPSGAATDASTGASTATGKGLARVLGPAGGVLMVLSCITPASSLFIIVPEMMASQGSGVVITVIAGIVVSVAVGACYAELGTRVASAGGEYAMVTHTLGKGAGWLTFALSGVLLWLIPPIIALGTADYLTDIVTIDRGLAAAVVMLLSAGIAILDVRSNAFVTGIFLGLEVLAASVVAVLGVAHLQRGPGELVVPHVVADGAVNPFTAAILVSGLTVGMFVVSGFGTAAYLAEEIVEPRRNVARVVFWSLGLGGVVILVPTITTVLAVDDLGALATGNFSEFVRAWGGDATAVAVNLGIAIAILNAAIVMVLQNARVVYASGRDRSWPEPVNRAVTRVHARWGSPWVATLIIGIPGAVLAYAIDIEALLGITSVVISAMYVVVALSALKVRRMEAAAGWRMPLWPLPPLLVVGVVGYALLSSTGTDLAITGALLLAAFVYYLAYLARKPEDRFIVIDPTDDPVLAD